MEGVEFTTLEQILSAAKQLPPLRVAVVDAGERFVLEGVVEAVTEGLIRPVLIGRRSEIRELLASLEAPADIPTVDADDDDEAAREGAELIEKGQVDAVMKGHIHTSEFLHPILDLLHKEGSGRRISHVFVVDLETYPKLLYITDGAINIGPDLKTKLHIARNAVELARTLGVKRPKVAALSAVEVVNPAIPSTIDAACLAIMGDRGQIAGAIVEGPLAFDNAISAKSAEIKGIESKVSGDVDILVVPDLVAANILTKDLEYLAGAQLAGLVVGAPVPVILTSRADPPRARLLSCAAASVVAHRQAGPKVA